MANFQLTINEPGKPSRSIPLRGTITVGRSRKANVIVDDDEVSGVQFRICERGGRVLVEAVGITNPTAVDKVILPAGQKAEVQPGTRIRVGRSIFTVEQPSPAFGPSDSPGAQRTPASNSQSKRTGSMAVPDQGSTPSGAPEEPQVTEPFEFDAGASRRRVKAQAQPQAPGSSNSPAARQPSPSASASTPTESKAVPAQSPTRGGTPEDPDVTEPLEFDASASQRRVKAQAEPQASASSSSLAAKQNLPGASASTPTRSKSVPAQSPTPGGTPEDPDVTEILEFEAGASQQRVKQAQPQAPGSSNSPAARQPPPSASASTPTQSKAVPAQSPTRGGTPEDPDVTVPLEFDAGASQQRVKAQAEPLESGSGSSHAAQKPTKSPSTAPRTPTDPPPTPPEPQPGSRADKNAAGNRRAIPTTVTVDPSDLPPGPSPFPSGRDSAPPLQSSMARLVLKANSARRLHQLTTARVVVGRGEACDLPIDDDSVSTTHAEILFDGSSWVLRDCDSNNGTFVDGARLRTTPVPLSRNALLAFGTVPAIFLSHNPDTIARDHRTEKRALGVLLKLRFINAEERRQLLFASKRDPSVPLPERVLLETSVSLFDWANAIATVRAGPTLIDRLMSFFGSAVRLRRKPSSPPR